MSMLLFALCVDPLLRILDQKLPGVRIGKRARKTVEAYADDIIIFVTTPTDVPVISDAIHCYEKATGARLNTRKSKALVLGGWITSTDSLNILYHAEIKFLGVTFAITFDHSKNKNWVKVTGKVRAQARYTYERNLSLSERILYVQAYFKTKIHTAYRPGIHGTHDVYPTIDDCYRMVHMVGSNVPCTNIDSTEAEETRLRLNSHRGEMSNSPDRPNLSTKQEEEICNSDMARGVEPGWAQGDPLT